MYSLLRNIIILSLFVISKMGLALTSQTISGEFHGVLVKGDITVRLHHTNGLPYAVMKGAQSDLTYAEFKIDKDILKICIGKGYPKLANIVVDVWVNDLLVLKQYGVSHISGHHLYSSGLHLMAKGSVPVNLSGNLKVDVVLAMKQSTVELSGIHSKHLVLDIRHAAQVQLSGVVGVCKLNMSDDSHLRLHWMNTNTLKLLLKDRAHIEIAGQVMVLDLEMFDESYFAGRYLRANRVFVKTHQQSVAEVSAVRSQHTYALDQSHIDFFNVPLMKTDFMVENAAVLDLREWTMPYGQEDPDFTD